jgi:hydroxymethylglutaryl-CoA synthase
MKLSIEDYEVMFKDSFDLSENQVFADETAFSISEIVDNHLLYKK